jgi:methionyl aminopeptidase
MMIPSSRISGLLLYQSRRMGRCTIATTTTNHRWFSIPTRIQQEQEQLGRRYSTTQYLQPQIQLQSSSITTTRSFWTNTTYGNNNNSSLWLPTRPISATSQRRTWSAAATSSSEPVDVVVPTKDRHTTKDDDTFLPGWRVDRKPIGPGTLSPKRMVPSNIVAPLYATTGGSTSSSLSNPYDFSNTIPIYDLVQDREFLQHMRHASQIAATVLRDACDYAQLLIVPPPSPMPHSTTTTNHTSTTNTITTDDIDALVHERIISYGAYPSPLNYSGFPKSVCTSVNEVICHGIPDTTRVLQYGDVVSIDVSCYVNQVHGDNCATIIVGDYQYQQHTGRANNNNDKNDTTNSSSSSHIGGSCTDWRNVPYQTQFATRECQEHFVTARRLVQASREALMTAIATIRPNVSYLSDIGNACQQVADQYGYTSVMKYRGHGIGKELHTQPFIKHFANQDTTIVREGMIFTIEPMFCQYAADCEEWESDHWTVVTSDYGLASQFEHTILVTATGAEILTLPLHDPNIGRDYSTSTF